MSTTASGPADKASAITGNGVAAPEILWAQRSSEDEPEKVSECVNVQGMIDDVECVTNIANKHRMSSWSQSMFPIFLHHLLQSLT